jgi:uncharacterized integral membrane protein
MINSNNKITNNIMGLILIIMLIKIIRINKYKHNLREIEDKYNLD